MRVSADRRDPGYRDDYRKWQATLDGKVARDVVTADTDQGLMYVSAVDREGRVIFDHVSYEFPTACLRGVVTLERLP